jgi:hypothetical protein
MSVGLLSAVQLETALDSWSNPPRFARPDRSGV